MVFLGIGACVAFKAAGAVLGGKNDSRLFGGVSPPLLRRTSATNLPLAVTCAILLIPKKFGKSPMRHGLFRVFKDRWRGLMPSQSF